MSSTENRIPAILFPKIHRDENGAHFIGQSGKKFYTREHGFEEAIRLVNKDRGADPNFSLCWPADPSHSCERCQ